MRMTKLLLWSIVAFVSATNVVQAATQEEFNNLVSSIPAIAMITIFAIFVLSQLFKGKK